MVSVGVIGYGYWGPNLVRNFVSVDGCEVINVADCRLDRLAAVTEHYKSINTTEDPMDLLNDDNVDAVVIATAACTHYDFAKKALTRGKHVLIEKPMTVSSLEAKELIALGKKNHLLVMVDHTFLYTGAVQKIKELIEQDKLGIPKYYDATRINLGLFQPDVNVLWDLASHDVAILLYVLDEKPISVNAVGISHTENGIENIAYLTLNYASGFIAHINCSWISPVKVRQTFIGFDKKMIAYNDLESIEKIRIYDSGYDFTTKQAKTNTLVNYRRGKTYTPILSSSEALNDVAQDFISCIHASIDTGISDNNTPISNAKLGCEVIKILEKADQSLKNKGQLVML